MTAPDTVEIEPGGDTPLGSVIWLHGLGADGHDFEPIVAQLRLPDDLPLRFVFPHAPERPVTINGGMSMRAWYDILTLDHEGPNDEVGVRESGAILDALIRREQERGIAARQVVVAGFSQGGAIALHAALRFPERLAGLMALSTYLPLHQTLVAEVIDSPEAGNADLPIFMAHGTFDSVLPMQLGRDSADLLIESNFNVEWHDYPMAHAVCAEEIDDIRTWLLSIYEH
ncbi:MAG: alpha/beta fold hydrolase [Proteobacteria bacterium]|nr:alpha/beta fold hydrolase [Pseudomonadota bacterium]